MRKITTLKEIQDITLSMLLYLDQVCQEHNLTYFACDGTLLGTIRHHGFIPWDDDIDVWMPREDYKKLIPILNSDSSPYQIINPELRKDYVVGFGKMIHTGTLLQEHAPEAPLTAVFLDIFPYDGLPPKGTPEYDRHLNQLMFLESQRGNAFRTYRDTLKGKGNPVKWIRWAIRRIYGGKRIVDRINRLSQKYPVEGSEWIGCLCGGYRKTDMMPASIASEIIRMPFEGHMINVPIGYETYLKTLYGDYMKLPPIEEQVPRHTSDAWWID